MRIVAVTTCPTGVAHTYMAAEAIKEAAEQKGHEIRVETQGALGSEDTLTAAEIADADLVLIAAGKGVSKDRFVGKRLYEADVSRAMKDADKLIDDAIEKARVWGEDKRVSAAPARSAGSRSGGREPGLADLPPPHDGRELHDPGRGGRRHPARHQLHLGPRLRHRGRPLLQPRCGPRSTGSAAATARWASWSRSSAPASRSRSPTAPASPRDSCAAGSPRTSAPASWAA